jgi:hypothetical protein
MVVVRIIGKPLETAPCRWDKYEKLQALGASMKIIKVFARTELHSASVQVGTGEMEA